MRIYSAKEKRLRICLILLLLTRILKLERKREKRTTASEQWLWLNIFPPDPSVLGPVLHRGSSPGPISYGIVPVGAEAGSESVVPLTVNPLISAISRPLFTAI